MYRASLASKPELPCAAVCVLVGALVNSRYVGQRSADINCENRVTSKNPVWQTSPGEGAFGVVHGPLTQKHWLSTLSTTTKFMSELLPWQPVPDFMAKARLFLFEPCLKGRVTTNGSVLHENPVMCLVRKIGTPRQDLIEWSKAFLLFRALHSKAPLLLSCV